MNRPTAAANGLLRTLSHRECWDLLTTHETGRICYVQDDGPVVVPMNYQVFEKALWIRTASYSQVAIHLDEAVVAFEIDQADLPTHTGWSVLVRGVATHVLHARGAPPTWHTSHPWPDGPRAMTFRIEPRTITGRALKQADVRPEPGAGPGTIQRSPA